MAARYPEQAAIIDNEKAVSYAALETEINNYAAKLISLGISAGDRVLVFVPMSIRMYTVVLALFRIGATTVFLDEWVSWKRLNICCELADCKAFIAGPLIRLLGLFSSGVRKIPIKTGTGASQLATVINTVEVDATHPALITFTTGSTGIPKAALRSHGFLYQQYLSLIHI